MRGAAEMREADSSGLSAGNYGCGHLRSPHLRASVTKQIPTLILFSIPTDFAREMIQFHYNFTQYDASEAGG